MKEPWHLAGATLLRSVWSRDSRWLRTVNLQAELKDGNNVPMNTSTG
ncbi:hypothetical protein [Bradyrhizobium sp. WSM1417]|nr:hypothetical protein [Bradyrhizobium sp. WSM1417]